jgi:hypothetical protein
MRFELRRDASGVSLISTLLVLIIMGTLAAMVFASLNMGDSKSQKETKSLLKELNAPTPAGQAAAGAAAEANMGGAGVAPNPPSLAGAARTTACKANVGTVEAALANAHGVSGSYPPSLDALVAGRWIDAVPSTAGYHMSLEIGAGQPTGHVLVNGQPGMQGCEGPPQ